MSDDVYYTYDAVQNIESACRYDKAVEDVRTIYGGNWMVVGIEIADGEHPWLLVPKCCHFPEDVYSGGTPNLKVSIDGHVYEEPLTLTPPGVTAEDARPHDDLHAMYGTAVPSDVDLEELRRLIDEEDCTLAEALERMETLQSRSGSQPEYSHECSYCGSKVAIDADGQVVRDCETCDKRRYHEPIEGGDDD